MSPPSATCSGRSGVVRLQVTGQPVDGLVRPAAGDARVGTLGTARSAAGATEQACPAQRECSTARRAGSTARRAPDSLQLEQPIEHHGANRLLEVCLARAARLLNARNGRGGGRAASVLLQCASPRRRGGAGTHLDLRPRLRARWWRHASRELSARDVTFQLSTAGLLSWRQQRPRQTTSTSSRRPRPSVRLGWARRAAAARQSRRQPARSTAFLGISRRRSARGSSNTASSR